MRKSTFASLLILCGSTAALAGTGVPVGQVAPQTTNNSMIVEDPAMNDTAAPVPDMDAPANTMTTTPTMPTETPSTADEPTTDAPPTETAPTPR